MNSDEHLFVFECPNGMLPDLIASAICDAHGLNISDFDLVEVSLNMSFANN